MSDKPVIVTTSWDDGHTLDIKTAELLSRYGLKGTFYVAFNEPAEPQISENEIRELHNLGMEIGSHTMSHRMLTEIPLGEIPRELFESKKRLDDILGTPIRAISYPLGYYNSTVLEAWRNAGYTLGRTTKAFQTGLRFEPHLMPITVDFLKYPRFAIARHAARDLNVGGLLRWAGAGLTNDPPRLARHFFDKVAEHGGLFHLYARSWEIEDFGLWGQLEALLQHITDHKNVRFVTNSGALDAQG